MKFKQYLKTINEDFKETYGIKQVKSGLGFSETKQKWYGWSHRAVAGFGIGDKLFDENWTPDGSEPSFNNKSTDNLKFQDRGSIIIKTLEQAKEAAQNFSKYVS